LTSKLHPRLAKTRALSTATLDDEIAASKLTQFQLGELVGIDDRAVRRLLDPQRKRADRLDLLTAIRTHDARSTCGKVTGLLSRASAMPAGEAEDKVVRIDSASPKKRRAA
jgi:hypothetical protein